MNTTFWGPSGWEFLHTLTFIYPVKPSYNDKVKMQQFMNTINYILPCKYCRISFTKYTKNLPINDYLDSREKMVEWLYKIHNKVNKKLRKQGFCKYDNPELSTVKDNYKPILEHITSLCKKNNDNDNDKHTSNKDSINYICNLGRDFLGSIVFNYQGYFSNCHTGDEKVKIVSVYHTFFNSIIPLLTSYIEKLQKELTNTNTNTNNVSRYIYTKKNKDNKYSKDTNYNTFKIRTILTQNEAYTKIIKWFYNCKELCSDSIHDSFKTFEDYMTYYSKNIVLTCNTPVDIKGDIIKSCRKITLTIKHKMIRNKTKSRHTNRKL
jgi:hypothetical protein